jgi:alpha-amylase
LPKFQLVMIIHAHQPVGNFDSVLEVSYSQCYLPYVALLERHPAVRLGLHFSGFLLEWLDRVHPEYVGRLRALVERGQVEIVGGGFYEPILISIPREDRPRQLELLAGYVQEKFGTRPRGAWLTERVWEPSLPSSLAPAGVEYTLIDDNEFMSAGFDPQQLFGTYVAEDTGHVVKLIPGLKELRYLIPFREPQETIAFLKRAAEEHPGGFAAMGDDYEKFGGWPETYKSCYTDGWLERFYTAIEQNSDWLEMVPPGEAVDRAAPLGRADLPDASYVEMMEWALPTQARLRLQSVKAEFQARTDVQQFLRGSTWRGFLTKYSESNLLHKKMLHVSHKLRRLEKSRRRDEKFLRGRDDARRNLLRAQCNDAYWHGIFGGLYSPHLRTELWRALIRAESFADAALHRTAEYADVARLDFDADGREEVYFTSERYAALLKPSDGGTFAALDYRPAASPLINSIARRPESYHGHLQGGNTHGVITIDGQIRVKEEGLARWLQYDRWARNAFRVLIFSNQKTADDYARIALEEDPNVAGGDFRVIGADARNAVLVRAEDSEPWYTAKKFTFSHRADGGFEIACDVSLEHRGDFRASAQFGIETVFNFLAPDAPDRYFEFAGLRHPLRYSGVAGAPEIELIDHWQQVRVGITAAGARDFWISPIEAVSDSEGGFERVYQGSQILGVWAVEMEPRSTWTGRLVAAVSPSG